MNEVLKAARDIQDFCGRKHWKFCIIGGLALIRWGEPRETIDVDVTLLTGFGKEGPFIAEILNKYPSRIDDAAEFAFANRVILARTKNGVGLDIALAALPFEEKAIERSTLFEFARGVSLRTCSAEDLIVFKAFAARPKDWSDIEGILVRQTANLDWTYVRTQLDPLVELKGAPDILHRLEGLRKST